MSGLTTITERVLDLDERLVQSVSAVAERSRAAQLTAVAATRVSRPRTLYALAGVGAVTLRAQPREFLRAAAATFAGWTACAVLKRLIGRSRPACARQPPTESPEGASCPSSHATTAFALASACEASRPRLVLYVAAAVLSFHRVLLGEHYVSDVAAGALVGSW